ncbi:MAG: glycine zipper domain-containing protein [Pirellulaceae bacterium]|nr:glycine zipper domain-containing protein [Pirellulaceae bacterium]
MAHRKIALYCLAGASAAFGLSSQGLSQTRDGAVLGGVAGAVIGGIIGHQNNETPEGALIGGAVGAVAGGVLGKQQEQQRQIRYYEQQQAYNVGRNSQVYSTPVYSTHVHTTPVYSSTVQTVPVRRPVSIADVIALTRSGVSENVIINHINASGVAYQPNTDDVLTMHDAGVCDYVIEAMQRAPVGGTVVVSQAPIPQRQVIIHEQYSPAPVYVTRPIHPGPTTYHYHSNGQPTHLQASPYYRRNF